jgi:hypothetical protein
MQMENINIEWVSKEEVDNILKQKKFRPWSREAQILFHAACQAASLPIEWAKSEGLHKILSSESGWVVWRLNYTIHWHSPETFKAKALSSRMNNPIWSVSTASWLWQLLLSNVDKYYPDWRNGIWDALNEAVWMLRYIKDRYWSPEVAISVYGRTWTYTHAVTWQVKNKTFREWY